MVVRVLNMGPEARPGLRTFAGEEDANFMTFLKASRITRSSVGDRGVTFWVWKTRRKKTSRIQDAFYYDFKLVSDVYWLSNKNPGFLLLMIEESPALNVTQLALVLLALTERIEPSPGSDSSVSFFLFRIGSPLLPSAVTTIRIKHEIYVDLTMEKIRMRYAVTKMFDSIIKLER